MMLLIKIIYIVKKSNIIEISILDKNIIIAEIARNGPNGISWLFFSFKIIIEIGSAIIAAKNTDITDIGNPNTKPNTPNNLISPPPIDSFLNKKSPRILSENINIKAHKPCNKLIPSSSIPLIKNFKIIKINENTINILSGIIIVW